MESRVVLRRFNRTCTVVRLDTNATLTDAIALYERNGYRAIERYNDNPCAVRWFEKDVRSR
jgi:hypothetical protein